MSTSTRVLIVDDSKAIGAFLTEVISADPDLQVVGHALDPLEARSMIKTLNPDVLTLDVEMPHMDGITFLRNLMRLRPMPVVMLSSLTSAGAEVTLDALAIGAVDFLVKRSPKSREEMDAYAAAIIERVKGAAVAQLTSASQDKPSTSSQTAVAQAGQWASQLGKVKPATPSVKRVLALGASTGGTEALRTVLESFYAPDVAVVLVQHMPERFMAPFANRLNSFSQFNVAEAGHLEELKPGHVYVGPGDRHLTLTKRDGALLSRLTDEAPCSGHRPSVDVLFNSVAKAVGPSAVGALLTGMGSDGAVGLLNMREAGAITLVQDRKTSAVWGMPGSAVRCGAAMAELPLQAVGPILQTVFPDAAPKAAAAR